MKSILGRGSLDSKALLIVGLVSSGLGRMPVFGIETRPLSGVASYETGMIMEGDFANQPVDREWLQRTSVWLLQGVDFNDELMGSVGIGGTFYFVYPRALGNNPYAFSKRFAGGLVQSQVQYTLGGTGAGEYPLQIQAGVFPFKYNPDVKNLGEYMFRTWTYPGFVTTGGFDVVANTGVQLSGLRVGAKNGVFQGDVLLTSEADSPPLFDWSVTAMANCHLGWVDLGAGIMFDNILSIDDEATTPKTPTNEYYTFANGERLPNGHLRADSLVSQGVAITDTSYYTYQGTKLMGRLAVRPQHVLGLDMLGPNDLTIYIEAILLGWKDYPFYYEKKSERMPVTFGFNLPSFKFLDVFAIEFERYAFGFPMDTENAIFRGTATPTISNWYDPEEVGDFHKDDWKWTLYAERTVVNGFRIVGQMGRDHLRTLDELNKWEWSEMMLEGEDGPLHFGEWYWAIKLAFNY